MYELATPDHDSPLKLTLLIMMWLKNHGWYCELDHPGVRVYSDRIKVGLTCVESSIFNSVYVYDPSMSKKAFGDKDETVIVRGACIPSVGLNPASPLFFKKLGRALRMGPLSEDPRSFSRAFRA